MKTQTEYKVDRAKDMRAIRNAKKRYGSSLTVMAKGTGLSRGHLSRVFNGKAIAGDKTIIKLKQFFRLRPYYYDDNCGVEKWT